MALSLRSIADVARRQRLYDNDAPHVTPDDTLAELRDGNLRPAAERLAEALI